MVVIMFRQKNSLHGSEGVLFKMNEPETPKVYEYLAKELPENAVEELTENCSPLPMYRS